MNRTNESPPRAPGRGASPLLQVEGLVHYYHTGQRYLPAVDGVDFTLNSGEILGIVGESGCGKSTVAKSLMGLLPSAQSKRIAGKALYGGRDLFSLKESEMRQIRGGEIGMIFQNPQGALDPVYTVGDQLREALRPLKLGDQEASARALELLRQVNIPSPEVRLNQYPHELSGGMQQRVMIAVALAARPRILLADEPTTALDVTIQAQILRLIRGLCETLDLAVLIITHNIGVVASICDRVLVMYGGVVVEEGTVHELFAHPKHPYTRGLLQSVPSVDRDVPELYSIPGQVPVFAVPVQRCRFYGRCASMTEDCRQDEPPLTGDGTQRYRCRYTVEEQYQNRVLRCG